MWPLSVKMPTQNSLMLLLLLMLMMRIMLATVCCKFRSWSLVIKVNFCSDFEHKVWSRFWSWSSGKILKPGLVNILNLKLRRDADVCWCRYVKVGAWSIFWRWNVIKFCVRPSGLLCLRQCFFLYIGCPQDTCGRCWAQATSFDMNGASADFPL